jgi:nucleoredoxin
VFVSNDRDQDSFSQYFREMPWVAIPYDDSERRNEVQRKFGVTSLPTLVVLSKTGSSVSKKAIKEVLEQGEKCFKRWLYLVN